MIRFKAQEFGQALHRARHERGGSPKAYPFGRFYPVSEVSREAGLTTMHINRLERGEVASPTFVTVAALARWMGRNAEDFVEYVDETATPKVVVPTTAPIPPHPQGVNLATRGGVS